MTAWSSLSNAAGSYEVNGTGTDADELNSANVCGRAGMNFALHALTVRGETHVLSFYEVELLRLLYERVGQPVARDEILGEDPGGWRRGRRTARWTISS